MAFVLDPEKFGTRTDTRSAARREAAEAADVGATTTAGRSGDGDGSTARAGVALTALLADSGWQTVVVGPHTEVARAWAAIGSATPVGVR